MITLIENNEKFNYKIYRSSTVCHKNQAMVSEIHMARNKFNQIFPGQDMTWSYKKYNTFCLVSGELMFYNLFEDLVAVIKEHTKNLYGSSHGSITTCLIKCSTGTIINQRFTVISV